MTGRFVLTWAFKNAMTIHTNRSTLLMSYRSCFKQLFVIVFLIVAAAGCSLSNLVDVKDPTDILTGDAISNDAAANAAYRGAITFFTGNIAGGSHRSPYFLINGAAADEYLYVTASGVTNGSGQWEINSRRADIMSMNPYGSLHELRFMLGQSTSIVTKYGSTTPPSATAELLALKGYIYIYFGETFCSGIPFGEAPDGGPIVINKPISTEEVYTRSLAIFDSALEVVGDDANIKSLALVGKARALMNLHRYEEAADLVSQNKVLTDFAYNMFFVGDAMGRTGRNYMGSLMDGMFMPDYVMGDNLGINGLDYMSAGSERVVDGITLPGDPRVPVRTLNTHSGPASIPDKYGLDLPIPVANGIEARLIEAEALLAKSDVEGWAAVLNGLRQNAITPKMDTLPDDSTTLATASSRVDLHFRERAFWLYGTGHRLGDMRRLVRQYGRDSETVFPTGTQSMWPAPNNLYGTATNLTPPKQEIDYNPDYNGCFNRDA